MYKHPLVFLLNVVIGFYTLVLCWYWVFGGFDFRVFGARILLDGYLKPYQILLSTVIVRIIIFAFPGTEFRPGAGNFLSYIFSYMRRNPYYIMLAAALLFSFAVRIWNIAQGLDEEVYLVDAGDHIAGTIEYLKGNYLFDTNYPFFTSHFAEYGSRLFSWIIQFLDFERSEIDITLIVITARTLNLLFTAGIFFCLYKIGSLTNQKMAAVLAIFFTGVSTTEVHMSHYFNNDLPSSFFGISAVTVMLLNLHDERKINYGVIGLFLGLAVACKVSGVMVAVYLIAIYIHLNPNLVMAIRNSGNVFRAIFVCIAVYFLVYPLFWFDPAEKLHGLLHMGSIWNSPLGLNQVEWSGPQFLQPVMLMYENFDYMWWVTTGLFDPIPMWIGIPAFAAGAYFCGRNLAYLWVSPIIIYIIGRLAKPNSLAYQYLFVTPLILFVTAIGIWEGAKLIPQRFFRYSLLATLVCYLGYATVQDTSFFGLPPITDGEHRWADDNLSNDGYGIEKTGGLGPVENMESNVRLIRKFNNGMEWAYSLHRDASHYYAIDKNALHFAAPALFPKTQFVDNSDVAYIFPASRQLATTERIFSTDGRKKFRKTRYVKASEAAPQIVIWVKNYENPALKKFNKVTISVGNEKREFKLAPRQSMVVSFDRDKNKSWLYYNKFLVVTVSSKGEAAWMVGANDYDIGSIYKSVGSNEKMYEAFLHADSACGLLEIIADAKDKNKKDVAVQLLKKKYPELWKAILDYRDGETDIKWADYAGYDDRIFVGKMSKFIGDNNFNRNITKTPQSMVAREGSIIFGPYIPLMKGLYDVEFKWRAKGDGASFTLDIFSGQGGGLLFEKILSPSETKAGFLAASFVINELVNHPVEMRLRDVKGGDVLLESVSLKIDYIKQLKETIRKVREFLDLSEGQVLG